MQAPTFLLTERIASRVLALRGQWVMLDAGLSKLYGVETRVLIQAIKRNALRFPADFMFQLLAEKFRHWLRRSLPRTQCACRPGVPVPSTVLSSERAVVVNIEIIRTIRKVRTLVRTQQDLAKQLTGLQEKNESLSILHDTLNQNIKAQLREVFETLCAPMTPPTPPKKPSVFALSSVKKTAFDL